MAQKACVMMQACARRRQAVVERASLRAQAERAVVSVARERRRLQSRRCPRRLRRARLVALSPMCHGDELIEHGLVDVFEEAVDRLEGEIPIPPPNMQL